MIATSTTTKNSCSMEMAMEPYVENDISAISMNTKHSLDIPNLKDYEGDLIDSVLRRLAKVTVDAYIHPSAVMDESTLEKDKYKDTHKVNANERQTNQPINKNSYASSRKINLGKYSTTNNSTTKQWKKETFQQRPPRQRPRRTLTKRKVTVPASCVATLLGLRTSQQSPYKTICCFLAKQYGFLKGDLASNVFDYHRPMSIKVIKSLAEKLGTEQFDFVKFMDLKKRIEQLPDDVLKVPYTAGWFGKYVAVRCYLFDDVTSPEKLPILELFFALYVTDKKWITKAKRMPKTSKGMKIFHAKQAQEEDTTHKIGIENMSKMCKDLDMKEVDSEVKEEVDSKVKELECKVDIDTKDEEAILDQLLLDLDFKATLETKTLDLIEANNIINVDSKEEEKETKESPRFETKELETKECKMNTSETETFDVLMSSKKKVKFTQIHGKGFSIGSRADGELVINSVRCVSDAKRTKLLDKGSFLQLILYGASYKRNYAVVIHNSKSKVCLSVLCMKDHQKFIKERVIQPMQMVTNGLATNPGSFVRAFFSPAAVTERCQRLTQHIEQCPVPDISSLQMPCLVQLQEQTQEAAKSKIISNGLKSEEKMLMPTSQLKKSEKYQRWSKFLVMEC